jgi:hypothetical protein
MFHQNGMTAIPCTSVINAGTPFLKVPEVWILVDDRPLETLYQPWQPKCMILQSASPEVANFPRRKDSSIATYFMDVRGGGPRETANTHQVEDFGIDKGHSLKLSL